MSLGEKLRQARIEAGLSQRQLCGEEITRNMLSQLEHDTAKPSMTTLQYLAGRLNRPVSYFLEENTVSSVNASCMEAAWKYFESGNNAEALSALEPYQKPDAVYDREQGLLQSLILLALAEDAALLGRDFHARQLLARAEELESGHPWLPELKSRRVLLQSRLGQRITGEDLPDIDYSLQLHAAAALADDRPVRAAEILEAAVNRDDPNWCLLRGRAAMAVMEYGTAAKYLQQAEAAFPSRTIPMLEACYRELGDFKTAYYYACKARER